MGQRKTSKALIIFIKNPLTGKVKTRLAKDSSEDYALKVYHALLEHTRSVSDAVDATRYLYYSDHIPEVDHWADEKYDKNVQVAGDLGSRMYDAIHKALNTHDKIIIIGSDCIQLRSTDIEIAFDKLDQYDAIIGPALDGGYYLLGLKDEIPGVFQDINWSTDEVTSKTIEKILSSDHSCHLLRELSDIDFLDDWKKYGYEL
ncbi:MAG: glycosyltransferase [Saprospiraceae bacterium]|nr:glycosyltransferase [Saprospiraceae bacterium]